MYLSRCVTRTRSLVLEILSPFTCLLWYTKKALAKLELMFYIYDICYTGFGYLADHKIIVEHLSLLRNKVERNMV